ncbi:SCO1 protein [Fistulina hepatica ATCC 64428]|uniref:SCO1 protein n=1 Tax=Fistulina hepatica ATCC 64428 TaxID=1128425 RepID=A0A0D7A3J0_9AGAR|nr:SCO1 protein [Fistulina hepatica ATCC 64428]
MLSQVCLQSLLRPSPGPVKACYRALPSSSLWAARVNCLPLRGTSQSQPSARRAYSTQWRDKSNVGIFSPTSAALFILTGIGLFFYFRHEKQRMLEEREQMRTSSQYGRPKVGGPFSLKTHTGETFTEKDLLGKWSFVYFGFTNCPDICPTELDKVSGVLDAVGEHFATSTIFQGVFVTVDPARDPPSAIAHYLQDFHPLFTGLVGSYDEIKAICRAYRVYFSTPPNADPKGDYLVDHSIYIYLMDPEGNYVDAFGQNSSKEDIVEKVREVMGHWRPTGK